MRSALSHLECSACGESADANVLQNLCPACGGILLARYDLKPGLLSKTALADRPRTLWRYAELLPVQDQQRAVTLGEDMTPLRRLPGLTRRWGLRSVALKDDGALPTGSFKARGAAVGVTRLRELGGGAFVMPTNGNAGSAWSAYAAAAGLDAHIVVPQAAPPVTIAECRAAGADVRVVDGLIDLAGRMSGALAREEGWFDAGTFKEPYRLEGKKTLGFEIAEQSGWLLPDAVVYPTGGGVGLIGMWKAWAELRELGLIRRLPRLVAAQAAGCAPVVRAFQLGLSETQPWAAAHTHAFGINVPSPLAGRLMLAALEESGGCAVAVEESGISAARELVRQAEDFDVGPEGACAVAAAGSLAASGWFGREASVVIVNTGSGAKY